MIDGIIQRVARKLAKRSGGEQRKSTSVEERDFSLESGERQTGKQLQDVRYDHRVRYKFAVDYLNEHGQTKSGLYGLDIFCGTGYGTKMLSINLPSVVLGIDGSSEAISFANQHFSNERTLYAHKVFPFTLPANTFDFITCYESLEHTDRDQLFVEELNSSLKEKGYLFLSTPNEIRLPIAKNPNRFHHRHYRMQDLMSLVSRVTKLDLLIWLGQNLYTVHDGKVSGDLPAGEMELCESKEGQFLLYVFKK